MCVTHGQITERPPQRLISKTSRGGTNSREFTTLIPPHVWKRIAYYRRAVRLVRHLDQHPDQILTLDKASCIACMERTAFSRFFRQRIGVTFSEFLRAYRVELAMNAMLADNASLKEIARSVGFNSFATFERQFKREVGLCPSTFRSKELGRIGLVTRPPQDKNQEPCPRTAKKTTYG